MKNVMKSKKKNLDSSVAPDPEERAWREGYRMLLTSVSPENAYSRNNIRALGYRLQATAILYGGLDREIYVKELSAPADTDGGLI